MKNKILLITPVYILAILLVFSVSYNAQAEKDNNQLFASNIAETNKTVNEMLQQPAKEGVATLLKFPSLDYSVPVNTGSYDVETQTWTLTNDAAYFAVETNNVSNDRKNGGLTLVYGHNTKQVFGITTELKENDIVEVDTENGLVFSYRFIGDEIVSPTNTSIFNYTGEARLALMACTGLWNESRRIMSFEFISVRDL